MNAEVHHINQMARRVCVANAVVSLIPQEHAVAKSDDEFLARFLERAGDMGYAYRTGGTDIRDELLKIAATIAAWIDKLGEEAAR